MNVKKGFTFLFALLLLLSTNMLFAQNATVSGMVTDTNGEPLTGVSVAVKGTTRGSITDIDGKYSVQQVSSQTALVFSYIGYLSQEILVGNRTTINVVLIEDQQMIDEVVVIGYGSVKRSDVTGSIVSVNAEEMMKRNPITVGQGLQGVAAGVAVYRNSGDPTGDVTVRIRGIATINNSADPLYVVDGIPAGTSINFLNPNDIESLEVLKDASATAIYGSQGANGVILVTTKRGQKGQTRMNFIFNSSITTRAREFAMLDAYGFAHMARETADNDNAALTNPAWVQYDKELTNINWQREMSQVAFQNQYNMNVTGGNDNVQSMLSVGYIDNDGLLIASSHQRLNLRANIDYKVKEFIRTGINLNFTYTENFGTGNSGNRNLVNQAALIPTMDKMQDGVLENTPIQWPNGDWGFFMREGNGSTPNNMDNPVAAARTNHNHSGNTRLFATSYIEIDLMKNLTFKTIGGLNYYTGHSNNYQEVNLRTYSAMTQPDQMNYSGNSNKTFTIESYLNYSETFNLVHRINLMAGWSASKYDGQTSNINVKELPFPTLRQISSGNQSTLGGGGNMERERRNQSFFGRAIYTFNDKYVFTGIIRRDGSSNFGPGNRYGTFPSASALWRISEEGFMKTQNLFSKLNLRLGWGQSGNAGNSTNNYVEQLTSSRIVYWWYDDSGNPSLSQGLAQTKIVDTNLKWETNEVTNINLEMGFLKNELTVSVEYFLRDAKDLLLDRSVRPSTGYTKIYTNAGQIRNSGVDINMTYQKRTRDWGYSLKLNGGFLKNEVIDIGELPIWESGGVGSQDGWNNWSRTVNGEPIAAWYGYRVAGIFQNQAEIDQYNAKAVAAGYTNFQGPNVKPGDIIFKDLDGNGTITDEDREVLGHGFPKFNYGLSIDLNYKNWDLNLFMYGIAGQKILSYTERQVSVPMNGVGFGNILKSVYDNAWRPTNTNTDVPRLSRTDLNQNRRVSDYWIHSGDFLKFANLQIGYNFSKSLIRPLKMETLRLTAGVENLFTFTGYKYGDPEIGSNQILRTGLDSGQYPTPRIFRLGLSVGF